MDIINDKSNRIKDYLYKDYPGIAEEVSLLLSRLSKVRSNNVQSKSIHLSQDKKIHKSSKEDRLLNPIINKEKQEQLHFYKENDIIYLTKITHKKDDNDFLIQIDNIKKPNNEILIINDYSTIIIDNDKICDRQELINELLLHYENTKDINNRKKYKLGNKIIEDDQVLSILHALELGYDKIWLSYWCYSVGASSSYYNIPLGIDPYEEFEKILFKEDINYCYLCMNRMVDRLSKDVGRKYIPYLRFSIIRGLSTFFKDKNNINLDLEIISLLKQWKGEKTISIGRKIIKDLIGKSSDLYVLSWEQNTKYLLNIQESMLVTEGKLNQVLESWKINESKLVNNNNGNNLPKDEIALEDRILFDCKLTEKQFNNRLKQIPSLSDLLLDIALEKDFVTQDSILVEEKDILQGIIILPHIRTLIPKL